MIAQCWVYKYSGTSQGLNAISFADAHHGFIVGDGGTVRYTTNGGTSWIGQNLKVTSPFYAVDCLDSHNVTMVGYDLGRGSGMIYHTTNGGATWSRQNSGTIEALFSVSFINRDTGLTVGNGGIILRTTDGGSSWIPRASGVTRVLYGVAFLNDRVAIVVGNAQTGIGGIILRTTNTGATWSTIATTSRALNSVSFSDSSIGYAVGPYGMIFKTTNGGLDWLDQSINLEYFFNSVSFIDSNRGTAVGITDAKGLIVYTTDGGSIWQRITHPNNFYNGVAVHDSTIGTVIGWYGNIIHQGENCSQNGWLSQEFPINNDIEVPLATTLSISRSVVLQWNLLADINIIGTTVELATDSTFAIGIVVNSLVMLDGSRLVRKLTVPDLQPGTTYYWRLKVHYRGGSSTLWTNTWQFTTASGSISGQIFEDLNRDSTWNVGERSLAGWRVDIAGVNSGSVLTDSAGRFTFVGLSSGLYSLRQALPVTWVQTVPEDSAIQVVLAEGEAVSGLLYGNYFPWNSVQGTVFDDVNENGIRDNGEAGLAQWLVRMHGSATDSVLTDNDGKYVFSRLTLGTLTFYPVVQHSWEQIYPQLGGERLAYINNFDQHYIGLDFSMHRIPSRIKLTLFVKDSTSFAHREIWWGVRPGATRGIWGVDEQATNTDFSEGEFEIPPQTYGLFDARFENPSITNDQFGYGSWTDMRHYSSPTQIDTFRVTFRPGYFYGGDYPMTLRWSKIAIDTSFDGSVLMSNIYDNIVNMKTVDSLVIADPAITSVTIVASYPRLPVVAVEEPVAELPKEFALFQNYPNPFNPTTIIRYTVPDIGAGHVEDPAKGGELPVRLVVYNVLGQQVAELVNEVQSPGYKSITWTAIDVPSGVYFYRLTAGKFSDVKKLLLLK